MIITTTDAETGITTEREATEEEIAYAEKIAAETAALESKKEAQETLKQEVLTKLGLTAEEVAALLA